MNQDTLVRKLGAKEAISLVVGTVIGTGVFLKAGVMSQSVGSPFWVLAAWAVAGFVSFIGALCYAELGSLYPRAGGEYVFLREAYGDLVGFLYGWMRFWIGTPGSIAAYGVGAATFLGGLIGHGTGSDRATIALAFIITFSLVNCFTVVVSGRLQSFMALLKVVMILLLTIGIFIFAVPSDGGFLFVEKLSGGEGTNGSVGFGGWSAFGTAMLAALWAYDGWNNMPMAAGEIRDPSRNIPRALLIGMSSVLAIYGAINLAYFYALPFQEVLSAYSPTNPSALPVATKAAQIVFGPLAVSLLSGAFVFSAIGSMNGAILTGSRIPYAMARDGLFIRKLGEVGHKSHAPFVAVVVQCLIACVLALSGTFDQLTDYVVFASWIFYALSAGALFIFRRRMGEERRAFSTPGYPWLPAIFVFVSLLLLLNTLITSTRESAIGLLFILAGVPFYFWFRRSMGVAAAAQVANPPISES